MAQSYHSTVKALFAFHLDEKLTQNFARQLCNTWCQKIFFTLRTLEYDLKNGKMPCP